jgi:hypothetical protein
MAVTCRVVADDNERDAVEHVEFTVVPRVGEFIQVADGVQCRVTRVLHLRATAEPPIQIEVTRQML